MNQKNNSKIKIILKSIFVFAIFGFSVQALAVWSVPTAVPPGNNTPPPINTGISAQQKTGSLSVSGFRNFSATILDTTLEVDGQVTITSGNPGVGKVLTSDADGNATWQVASGAAVWGGITGTLSNQTDLQTALNAKQNLLVNSAGLAGALSDETGTGLSVFSISPALTGIPTAPTAAPGTSTTQLATTAFVTNAVSGSGGISGTPNRLPKFSSTGAALEDSILFQNASGNIGINTTNPGARLAVLGNLNVGTNYANVAGQANGAIIEGNVGIGTNSPNTKLHLVGSMIIADGTQGINKILSSNVAGLAAWRTAEELGIGGSTGPWTRTGSNTHLVNIADSVGIGTASPSKQLHLTGSLELPLTTNQNTGVIYKGGTHFLHDYPGTGSSDNTFLGRGSGSFSLSGTRNTGLGANALSGVGSGSFNTAIGANSMVSLTSGSRNVGIGYQAMQSMVSGDDNAGIGQGALSGNSGSRNVGMGGSSLSAPISGGGNDNTALGYTAGYSLNGPQGEGNVFVGAGSCAQTTASSNCASATNWTNNTLIGRQTATKITSGNPITNATAIGYLTTVNASNTMVFGNGNVIAWGFGVQPDTSLNAIQVGDDASNGSGARLTKTGQWLGPSDRTKKHDIEDISYGLSEVLKLRPVDFKWNGANHKDVGFIAQEVKEIIPEIVQGEDGDMVMSYGQISAVLVKAIQEQQIQIETLQKEIESLKNK